MNFNEGNAGQNQANAAIGATMRPPSPVSAQYDPRLTGYQGEVIRGEETLGDIQQHSLKIAYELCSILNSIADAIGGPTPEVNSKPECAITVKATAQELRGVLQRALAVAQRIGSHL